MAGWFDIHMLKSREKRPSQAPLVPVPTLRPVRPTGGTTHWKLVPLPQELACRPLEHEKSRPSLLPSRSVMLIANPVAAEALGVPIALAVA